MAGNKSKGDILFYLALGLLLFGGAAGATILSNGVSGFFEVLGAAMKGIQSLLGVLAG